jgi:AcrR family transcriptional regulator
VGRKAGVTADETKDQLLAAAARVFAQRGYQGARVSEIAAEAGLTTGAIYAHYPTKADLLADAIRSAGPAAVASVFSTQSPDSILRMLEVLGAALPSAKARRPRSMLIEYLAAAQQDPQVTEVLRQAIESREAGMADLLRRGQDSGTVTEVAPVDAVARLITIIVLGSAVARAVELTPPDPNEWAAVIAGLVHQLQPGGAS